MGSVRIIRTVHVVAITISAQKFAALSYSSFLHVSCCVVRFLFYYSYTFLA